MKNIVFIIAFKKDGQLKKEYEIKKINKNCEISGNCIFISRYNDKESLKGINYDTFKTKIILKTKHDIYCEELHEQIIYSSHYNKYNSVVNYNLKKNNETISYDKLDLSILKDIK